MPSAELLEMMHEVGVLTRKYGFSMKTKSWMRTGKLLEKDLDKYLKNVVRET